MTSSHTKAQVMVADFGFLPATAFRAPYMLSESPHDFWGNRLDLAFQQLLKRSFYYPVRRYFAGAVMQKGGPGLHVKHVNSGTVADNGADVAAAHGPASSPGSGSTAYREGGISSSEGDLSRSNARSSAAMGAMVATVATFTASGFMHELLWTAMMWSVKDKDRARLGVDSFECQPDGRSTLYFVLQGCICIASTVVVASIPKRIWSAIPQVIKLYLSLGLGPFIGLHW